MLTLITGGAGFVGCNLATSLAEAGHDVVIVDDLSRAGSAANLAALRHRAATGGRIEYVQLDVRDPAACATLLASRPFDAVAHLAAQVAVTDAIADPLTDQDINVRGTLNMLDAVRRHRPGATFVFTSTNKVYGALSDIVSQAEAKRYVLVDYPNGISEDFPTAPVTPYGCSKLSADCYVRDYAQTFGLRTVVLRMSCIYGDWQNGTEDQGWVNWLVRAAVRDDPVTIYGDGLQVRDLLHVDDLVPVITAALRGECGAGDVFNVGGGPQFSLSVWAEFGGLLERLIGRPISVSYAPARPGDQKVYISDTTRIARQIGWKPRKAPADGIAEMVDRVTEREKGRRITEGSRR